MAGNYLQFHKIAFNCTRKCPLYSTAKSSTESVISVWSEMEVRLCHFSLGIPLPISIDCLWPWERNKGVARRKGVKSTPPRNGKNCCRKMMLFQKALFIVTKFPKLVKNSIFLWNFHQNFSKFSQNFPTICVIRPNSRKINAGFVKFFEKRAKIMQFSQFP